MFCCFLRRSHGKERLEGKPDTAKGSFYFNPVHDKPVRA